MQINQINWQKHIISPVTEIQLNIIRFLVRFYSDCQKDTKFIFQYGLRLKWTFCKATKQDHIDDAAKESILCSKLSTGVKNKPLINVIMNIFDSLKDFQS